MRRSPEKNGNEWVAGGGPFPGEQLKLPLLDARLRGAEEQEKRSWRRMLPNLQGVSRSQWVKIGAAMGLFLVGGFLKRHEIVGDFTMGLGKRLLKKVWQDINK